MRRDGIDVWKLHHELSTDHVGSLGTVRRLAIPTNLHLAHCHRGPKRRLVEEIQDIRPARQVKARCQTNSIKPKTRVFTQKTTTLPINFPCDPRQRKPSNRRLLPESKVIKRTRECARPRTAAVRGSQRGVAQRPQPTARRARRIGAVQEPQDPGSGSGKSGPEETAQGGTRPRSVWGEQTQDTAQEPRLCHALVGLPSTADRGTPAPSLVIVGDRHPEPPSHCKPNKDGQSTHKARTSEGKLYSEKQQGGRDLRRACRRLGQRFLTQGSRSARG